MKKAIFIALVLVGSLFGSVSPANSADVIINGIRYDCDNHTDRHGHTFKDGTPVRDMDLYVQITVAYRRCNPYAAGRETFYQPNYVVGSYNRHGSSMSCNNITRYWDGAKFNMYFYSPQRGANFNPPQFSLGCSEDTTASEIQNYDYADVPKFYEGPDHPGPLPRWRVFMTGARNGSTDETHEHSQAYNWAE